MRLRCCSASWVLLATLLQGTPCLAASDEVPTWTIVMLSFLSCLIVILIVALLFTLRAIKRLTSQLPYRSHLTARSSPLSATNHTGSRYTHLEVHEQPSPGPCVVEQDMVVDLHPTNPSVEYPTVPTAQRVTATVEPTLDPMEQESVDQLRAAMPRDAHLSYTIFGQPEVMDNEFFLRFLRARNFDPAKSRELMLNYLKWRRTSFPSGPPVSELVERLWRGVVYIDFLDKAGRAVIVLRLGMHDKTWPTEESKQVAVLFLDSALHYSRPHVHQFSVLVDLEGFGLANADLATLKNCLTILDQCYPERLGNLWFIHANFIFMNLWKMVRGFVNSNTANKIHFFGGDFREQLAACVDAEQLPRKYGGCAPDPPTQFLGRYPPPGAER
eukprot:GGOE01020464.1.p1 GENE.GGOE01020464.1~~GGOE01020464.1.p1  ORF type:complete len:385 (-),score=126.08 GGOE01020464.1:169-1323(-)